MRWIFLSLLILNLAYFGWQQINSRDVRPSTSPRFSGGTVKQQIVLLREAAEDDRRELKQVIDELIVAGSLLEGSRVDADQVEERRRAELLLSGGCSAIGPFDDVFKAQQVSRQLASLDIGLRVRAVDRLEDEFDYRLLIPPLNSPEAAFRKLRELQVSGIDSYVITAGPHALGISLGVYSSEASAESARSRFAQDGYATEKIKMTRTSRSYWLYYGRGLALDLDSTHWESLIKSNPGILLDVLPCE